jgi:phosphoribosyl 1,2-cyclic phosphate phosphodiesterase
LIIKFLGTGTSQGIPVVGCDCDTCTSENLQNQRLRSSVWIEQNDTRLIIDTGPDLRQQLLKYNVTDVDAILITHEHNDHTAGLDDIRPINFLHHKVIPLYAMERVEQNIRERFAYIFAEQTYPGSPRLTTHVIQDQVPFSVKDIDILPIEYTHGAINIFGYIINKFAYITDASHISDELINTLYQKGLKYLVLNALHMKPHHSHFNLEEALEAAARIGAEATYIIHMSHTMGPVEDWGPTLPDNVFASYDGLVLEI